METAYEKLDAQYAKPKSSMENIFYTPSDTNDRPLTAIQTREAAAYGTLDALKAAGLCK